MVYHIIQSFSPDDRITPQTAHEIGLKFAEYFPGYQIVVATHRNTDHIHNHIVMNSVNFETGKKFHQTAEELQKVKEYSNRLCEEYGLSQTEVKSGITRMPEWKQELRNLAYQVACRTTCKEDFIWEMRLHGYEVKWIDGQKYITFKTPDGHLCRDNKLFAEQLLRKNLEIYFLLGGCDSPLAEQYQRYANPICSKDRYTVEDGLFQLFKGLLETVPEDMQTEPPPQPDELDKETIMALESLGIKVEPKALACYSTREQYEQQMGLYPTIPFERLHRVGWESGKLLSIFLTKSEKYGIINMISCNLIAMIFALSTKKETAYMDENRTELPYDYRHIRVKRRPLSVRKMTYTLTNKSTLHFHDAHEFLFIEQGKYQVCSPYAVYDGEGPCIVFFKLGTYHGTVRSDCETRPYIFHVANFHQSILDSIPEHPLCKDKMLEVGTIVIPITKAELDLFLPLLERLERLTESYTSEDPMPYLMKGYFLAILNYLYELIREKGLSFESDADDEAYISKVIKTTIEAVSRGEDVSITRLAEQFYVSGTKLTKDFRSVTGISVKQMINTLRLERAKRLLRAGLSNNEVAARCGFSNTNYFIHFFNTHANQSPGSYRKMKSTKSSGASLPK